MNSADPLASLRDIHLPPAVGAWPPAPGWWLLLALLCLALSALLWWSLRRYRAGAYRRSAVEELQRCYTAWQATGDSLHYLQTLQQLLKRVALVNQPADTVAALSGTHWIAFLDRQWSKPPSTSFTACGLADLHYQNGAPACDIETIQQVAMAWLQQHRSST